MCKDLQSSMATWLVPDDEDGLPLLQGELVFILSGVWEQHQAVLFYCKRCHQFIA